MEIPVEIVVRAKKNKKDWFIMSFKEFDEMPIEERVYMGKSWEYYGAIWTEHGLYYIAKMNEDGVLEFLC